MAVTCLLVVIVELIAGLLSLVVPGWLAISMATFLFVVGAGYIWLVRLLSRKSAGVPDLAMDELFKYRRQGQSPEECVRSVIENMIRPENAELADSLLGDCSGSSDAQDEAKVFQRFATTLAIRTEGDRPLSEIAEGIVQSVRQSYELHRGALDGEKSPSKGEPDVRPDPLKPLDVLLKEHHAYLDVVGDIETWVYGGALSVFYVLWLWMKWRWWQAWLPQFGVMAVLLLASTSIARRRVERTAQKICLLYPPRSPHHEAALKKLSEVDRRDVQLISDVLVKTRSLAAEVRA